MCTLSLEKMRILRKCGFHARLFTYGVLGVSGQTGKDCLFTSENGRGVKSHKNKTKVQKFLALFCKTGVFLRLSKLKKKSCR